MKKKQRKGRYLLVFAFISHLLMTNFFGNNFLPSCPAELFWDIFFLGLGFFAIFLIRHK